MRRFGLLYDGPGAWLVWLNVLIGCAALIPTLLQRSFFVFHESGKFVGQTAFLPEMFSMLLLLAIGEKGYVLLHSGSIARVHSASRFDSDSEHSEADQVDDCRRRSGGFVDYVSNGRLAHAAISAGRR
jgi:hypothetical protein